MNIYAISDLHGNLFSPKKLDIPECDIFIIAGDIAPWSHYSTTWDQTTWFVSAFKEWTKNFPQCKNIVCIPGNHDFACGCSLPEIKNSLKPCFMLHDDSVEIDGCKIYGTAWQPYFNDWAFNCVDDDADLGRHFAGIPTDLDILVTHCPPHGVCDMIDGQTEHLGSKMLSKHIARAKPKINICGHIHSGYGEGLLGTTKVYNVSLLDESYKFVYSPTKIIL